MFSVFRTLSLRYLQRRWFRATLIVASIALGVATLVATRALNATMTEAANASANPVAGVADFFVSNGELPVPRAVLKDLRTVPGVRSVKPFLFQQAYLPDFKQPVLVMGLDFLDVQKEMKDPTLQSNFELSPDTIEKYFAISLSKRLGFDFLKQIPVIVGKALSDELPSGTVRMRVSKNPGDKESATVMYAGELEAHGNYASMGGFVLILELENAAEIMGLDKDYVSRVDVALESGVDAHKIRKTLEAKLGSRAVLRTPEEQNQAMQSVMTAMQTGFSLCGVAALVVGLFLVYNSLSVTVAERRHEIGILLALGATKLQILVLIAGEASVLGLIGGMLGVPLGLLLTHISVGPVQEILRDIFFQVQVHEVQASYQLLGLAVLAGWLTAVTASLVPAFQAARENPASSVRRVAKAATVHHLIIQIAASVLLAVVGTAAILMRDQLPNRLGTYGGLMLVLIGALVASPFFAAIAARLFQPFFRMFGGIEWRLASDNLVRSPGRTGLVIGALAAGVSLVVQTAGTIRSNRQALRDWVDDSIAADLIITAGGPVSAGRTQTMDEELGKQLKKLEGVEAVMPLRSLRIPYADTQVYVIALEPAKLVVQERKRLDNHGRTDLFEKLANTPNGVIVSENFAARHRVRPGETLTLTSPSGPLQLLVLGEIVDYSWNHGSLFLSRDAFKKHWKDNQVNVYDLYLHPGVDKIALKETINKRFVAYQVYGLTRSELQSHIDSMIENLYGIAYGQQMVVMLVAALGVVTALLISVLQRRREMGLLRAIGASRAQVIYSVLAEACLMGVVGTIIGLLVGIALQWYVVRIVILEESGYLFPVYIPWMGSLIIALAAMFTATLAGLGPAFYSVRMRIPEAIAYE